MKYPHFDKLKDYIKDGLVDVSQHATLPISIYNYSRKVQYESLWDEVTLECRGLILDNAGEIVARSFDKFFNIEEVKDLDWKCEHVWVQEKMDGSLGILFYYAEDWHMATKGSFSSEQAIKGLEIVKKKYDLARFMPEVAYICEIIYPENRIVCDYGADERVVFLSASSNDTELNLNTALMIFNISGIEKEDLVLSTLVTEADQTMADHLKSQNSENREGYVLRFWPGNRRVKIKFEDYVKLHRILTGFSSVDIWEYLKDGKDVNQLLENVPDEFDKWVKNTISDLNYNFYRCDEYCGKVHDYFRYGKYNDREVEPTRKEYAEHIKNNVDPGLHGIMWTIWDRKHDRKAEIIWKMIKPKFQKPFWTKEINNQTKFDLND
jgi:hypothetical protein